MFADPLQLIVVIGSRYLPHEIYSYQQVVALLPGGQPFWQSDVPDALSSSDGHTYCKIGPILLHPPARS